MVHAINGAILRNVGSADTGERREEIHDVNDLIADAARGNLAGPTDGEWRPQRGLHGSEVCTSPRAAVAFPRVSGLWTVVAGEDDDGIVFDAGFFDRIEDLARTIVHLGKAVGPIAVAGSAGELGIRQCGHVKERE